MRIGNDITITCSVRRGNPSNYVYTITNTDTDSTTTGPTRTLTNIQISDLATYRCDVTNDAGTGSSSVSIELGGKCKMYFRNQCLQSVFVLCQPWVRIRISTFVVVCLSLPHPTNGMISYSDPTLGVGSVASFSCDTGFLISDVTNTVTCKADGQWRSSPPTCMGMFISLTPTTV